MRDLEHQTRSGFASIGVGICMFLDRPVKLGAACLAVVSCVATAMLTGCDSPTSGSQLGASSPTGVGDGGTVPISGCLSAPPVAVAAGGYYVNGNTICTADGRPHLLHGVDRPSLEWAADGVHLSLEDFQTMASWNANVVRVALNQDFWLADSSLYAPSYVTLVDQVVGWAEQAGLDVILDLHWSDKGTLGSCTNSDKKGCQQLMADPNSLRFWTEVAAHYRADGRVAFELYNEPHGISWSVWLHGGTTDEGWQAVGMQELYDAVRATGANNLVVAGGLDWAYDLSGVPSNPIDGYNIVYATHPYNNAPERLPPNWEAYWGFLTATRPVIVTEFGDTSPQCTGAFNRQVIDFADSHHASWTAWAWFPSGCQFPSIIADWTGQPTVQGEPVQAALMRYGDPPAASTGDAGVDGAVDALAEAGNDADAGTDAGSNASGDAAGD
jgi:endoglucanase